MPRTAPRDTRQPSSADREYPTLAELREMRPTAILRDGTLMAVVDHPNAAFLWLAERNTQSVSYALKYNGYTCRYATADEVAR